MFAGINELTEKHLDRKFLKLERVAYLAMETDVDQDNREFTQRRRRGVRKRHLKIEFALPQTLSRLFHLGSFIKCWQPSLELNSKGLHQNSGGKKTVVFPVLDKT